MQACYRLCVPCKANPHALYAMQAYYFRNWASEEKLPEVEIVSEAGDVIAIHYHMDLITCCHTQLRKQPIGHLALSLSALCCYDTIMTHMEVACRKGYSVDQASRHVSVHISSKLSSCAAVRVHSSSLSDLASSGDFETV